MDKKDIAKADKFIIDAFKGLAKLVLMLSSGLLLIIMPFVFIAMAVASFLEKYWLEGLGYLVLVIISIYTARGLLKLIRRD